MYNTYQLRKIFGMREREQRAESVTTWWKWLQKRIKEVVKPTRIDEATTVPEIDSSLSTLAKVRKQYKLLCESEANKQPSPTLKQVKGSCCKRPECCKAQGLSQSQETQAKWRTLQNKLLLHVKTLPNYIDFVSHKFATFLVNSYL